MNERINDALIVPITLDNNIQKIVMIEIEMINGKMISWICNSWILSKNKNKIGNVEKIKWWNEELKDMKIKDINLIYQIRILV